MRAEGNEDGIELKMEKEKESKILLPCAFGEKSWLFYFILFYFGRMRVDRSPRTATATAVQTSKPIASISVLNSVCKAW